MTNDRHLWQMCWVRDLVLLALGVVVLWIAYVTRSVTALVVIAVTLAYIVNPLVTWAQRRLRVPRWASSALIIAVLATSLIAFMLWAVPMLNRQINSLWAQLPEYIGFLADRLGVELDWKGLSRQLNATLKAGLGTDTPSGPAAATLGTYAQPVGSAVAQITLMLVSVIRRTASFVTYIPVAAAVIAFCFYFFCWHWETIVRWFDQFIPAHSREKAIHIIRLMDRTVAGFIRGRLLQSLVMSLVLSLGWWRCGVPYWLLLGLCCGLLNLVPFLAVVGWLAALVLAGTDHVMANAAAYQAALEAARAAGADGAAVAYPAFRVGVLIWPTVIYLFAQGLDGWVVEPLIQGKATNLDPLTVLLSVLIGGSLAGLLGMLLAIPTAACIKILAREVLVPYLRARAQGDRGPGGRGRPETTEGGP